MRVLKSMPASIKLDPCCVQVSNSLGSGAMDTFLACLYKTLTSSLLACFYIC